MINIVTIGDSNALHGWVDLSNPRVIHTHTPEMGLDTNSYSDFKNNIKLQSYSFAGQLCYTFGRVDFDRFDINTFNIKEEDVLIFSYGEIDCRVQVHKFINDSTSYKNVIRTIVDNYFSGIKRELNNLMSKPKKICVFNIPPPTKKTDLDNAGHVSCLGSDEERKLYYNYFNKLLKEGCLSNDFIFFDIYDKLVDNEGLLDRKHSDGGAFGDFHLKKSKHIDEFIKNNII